jgi:FAD synthase
VAISYTDHPAFTLQTKPKLQVLCSASRKKRELHSLGVEQVELLRFTLNWPIPVLKASYGISDPGLAPKSYRDGYDSHFGHQRCGDYDFLLEHSVELGYRVEYVSH